MSKLMPVRGRLAILARGLGLRFVRLLLHAPLAAEHKVGLALSLVDKHLGRLVPGYWEAQGTMRRRHRLGQVADLLQGARLVPWCQLQLSWLVWLPLLAGALA